MYFDIQKRCKLHVITKSIVLYTEKIKLHPGYELSGKTSQTLIFPLLSYFSYLSTSWPIS